MRQKANAHAVCLISLETLTHENNCHVPHADMNVKVVWSMFAEASEIHSNTQTRHRGGTVASSLHLSSYCQTNKVSAVLSSNMPVLSALSWPRAPSFVAWSLKNKRIFEDIFALGFTSCWPSLKSSIASCMWSKSKVWLPGPWKPVSAAI